MGRKREEEGRGREGEVEGGTRREARGREEGMGDWREGGKMKLSK